MEKKKSKLIRTQKGSITLFGAMAIVFGLSALVGVLELANAKILDRHLDNYATTIAPVALRSQLTLSKSMIDEGVATVNISQDIAQEYLNKVTDSGSISVHMTFGNLVGEGVNEVFVPLEHNAETPKAGISAGETPPKFSAIALQLIGESTFGLVPEGKAIFGLPEGLDEDLASCFCEQRFNSCQAATIDTAGLPADLGNLITNDREAYCDYGYAPNYPGTSESKYEGIDVPVQFLGKSESKDHTGFFQNIQTDMESSLFESIKNHHPVKVDHGLHPFPTYHYSIFSDSFINTFTDRLYAQRVDYFAGMFGMGAYVRNDELKLSDIHSSRRAEYQDFGGFSQKVQGNGHFYVGRKGMCVSGTNASNVPNISALQVSVDDYPDERTDSEVKRCLSYTPETQMNLMPFFGGVDPRWAQFSCVDFNRQNTAKVGFFGWMMMSWTWPFIDWERSYEGLGCATRKMRWRGFGIWGGWINV